MTRPAVNRAAVTSQAVTSPAVSRVLAMIVVLLAVVGVGGIAGCTQRAALSPQPSGPSCIPASAASPASEASPVGPAGAPSQASPGGLDHLPDLVLTCLDSGQPVRLTGIGGPMVVNLWASWCGPCRQELPVFQRYADRVAGRVRVLGVATNDTASAARSLAADLHLSFPLLTDDQGRLLAAVGRSALPVTLFVDAHGRVSNVYNAQALDEPALDRLVETYLGVVLR